MKARVVRIGNSLGVILPRKTIRELDVKRGDILTMRSSLKHRTIVLSMGEMVEIDEDVIDRVEAFSKQYEKDLRRLAQ